jgi:hypothetical protein
VLVGDVGARLRDVVSGFADPRVRYRPRPEGITMSAHARVLLSEASGRYIGLLDDDDWLLPGCLDATIGCLDADPSVGVAFTNYFYAAGGRLHARDWPVAGGRHANFLPQIMRGAPLAPSAALIRRDAWEEGERRHPVGDDTIADGTMWLRTAAAGWAFHFVEERLAVHTMHPGQSKLREDNIRDRYVRLWNSFRFDDAECERLRRRRLAESLFARANLRIRRGRLRDAGHDALAALRVAPGRLGERELVALLGARHVAARLISTHPQLAAPAFAAWRVLQRVDRLG